MRCLILSPFVPFPPEDGGRIRVFELARGLARHGRVEVLALDEPGGGGDPPESPADALLRHGIHLESVPRRRSRPTAAAIALGTGRSYYAALLDSPEFGRRLRERIASEPIDLIQCEFPYLARYQHPADPPWILDQHNVESRLSTTIARTGGAGVSGLLYAAYAEREQARRRTEELAACRRTAHVLTVSGVDRDLLRDEIPGLEVTVVPNGVDLERFRPGPADEHERFPGAVFVGKMDYRPNVDGVRWFCTEVLPRIQARVPGFTFTIVGGSPTPAVRGLEKLQGVRVTGRVPDTRPFLRDAAVVVIPLRAGSGTRLKVLEAFAMGGAVVGTPLGCEGIDLEPGVHCVLADAPDRFADAVVQLTEDPARRRRLGAAARRLVEQVYGWDTAVETLADVHRRILAGAAPAGGH